jgi:hypothetical protein
MISLHLPQTVTKVKNAHRSIDKIDKRSQTREGEEAVGVYLVADSGLYRRHLRWIFMHATTRKT